MLTKFKPELMPVRQQRQRSGMAELWISFVAGLIFAAGLVLSGMTQPDKVIGFLDNSKRNFSNLADDMAGILQSEYGVASVMRRSKSNPSEPAPAAIIEELAATCDLVITGSGD